MMAMIELHFVRLIRSPFLLCVVLIAAPVARNNGISNALLGQNGAAQIADDGVADAGVADDGVPDDGVPDAERVIGERLVQTSPGGSGEPDSLAPFVTAFERFGRHEDLPAAVAGSLLISELSCVACHASAEQPLQPKSGPDLSDAGHRLQPDWVRDFLGRPHQVSPGSTMPDLLHGLEPSERERVVTSIADWLEGQVRPLQLPKANGISPVLHQFWDKGNADHGKVLYHTIGCVACHSADPTYEPGTRVPSGMDQLLEQLDPEEIEEMGLARLLRSVPTLPHFQATAENQLVGKYSKQALTLFLLNPHLVRPSGRMPSLRLSPSEAADLSAYLLRSEDSISELPVDDTRVGGVRVGAISQRGDSFALQSIQKFGCANCHQMQNEVPTLEARKLVELKLNSASSCLENPSTSMPKYQLDSDQLRAIISALESLQGGGEGAGEVASWAAERRMMQLNCLGCHERLHNESALVLGGIGRDQKPYFETTSKVDLGDEGRLPPSLTGVGAKLTSKALAGVFEAKTKRHRPFMTIRMPSYHASVVDQLVRHLPVIDGAGSKESEAVFFASDVTDGLNLDGLNLEAVGRELVNTGCVECHLFREENLPGAVGVDLHAIEGRVRPQWFLDFIKSPGDLKTRTRMPTFFPDGKSNRPDLLEGNVQLQIAAMWQYLKKTDPLPDKIQEVMRRDFELVPSDKPLVVRTFMRNVGTHAIAVGFPQGIHFAFDSERVHLEESWTGKYLDARGTWFERFVPLTEPLGEHRIQLPAGDLLAVTRGEGSVVKDAAKVNFQGYRVGSEGVPVFLYQIGSWRIEDRIEPREIPEGEGRALQRTLRIVEDAGLVNSVGEVSAPETPTRKTDHLIVTLHRGAELRRQSPKQVIDQRGLVVSVSEINQGRQSDLWRLIPATETDDAVWQVELNGQAERILKVVYQW